MHSTFTHSFLFQKQTLDTEHRQIISDEARHLYQEEPDLFAAANKEFEGNSSINFHSKKISIK